MDDTLLSPEATVAEVLERWPEAIPVFLRHHMACVGCALAAFETLGGAAAIYNIPTGRFLAELQTAIQPEA